jgi:hypothetical protein
MRSRVRSVELPSVRTFTEGNVALLYGIFRKVSNCSMFPFLRL